MKITHGGIESETRRRSGVLEWLRSKASAVMDRRGTWRGAFGAALAFTLFFSLYPHEAVDATFSEEVQAFDWLFHALCYATLSGTWLLGRAKRP